MLFIERLNHAVFDRQPFEVCVLKIDRSFISDVASNAGDASIVRAIISLAHGLSLMNQGESDIDRTQSKLFRLREA